MNIGFIIGNFLVGGNAGVAGVIYSLAEKFRQLGCNVEIVAGEDMPGKRSDAMHQLLFPFFAAKQAPRLFGGRADVLDFQPVDASIYMLRHRRRRPLVVARSHGLEATAHLTHLHDAALGDLNLSWKYPLYHGGLRLWKERMAIRRADLALLLNVRDREYAVSTMKADAARTRLVRNGIPDNFVGLPPPSPIGQDEFLRLASIGTFRFGKGRRWGIPAVDRVLSKYPTARISFFGTACPAEDVLAGISEANRNRVSIVPQYQRKELPALLKGHHIHLFPSLSEGFPLAPLEAMACGLTVVSTDIPGPTEIVRQERNGLLIPPRDPDAIVDAISRLFEDHALLDRLRQTAHNDVQSFNWDAIARNTLTLYEEGMRARPPAR